jgi:hypothetical protein
LSAATQDQLETAVLEACVVEGEWPAQIAAAVCAGVDFVIARPEAARALVTELTSGTGQPDRYGQLIGRLAGFVRAKAPSDARLPASTDEAMVAGIVGLVGDHVRLGRLDRLSRLRPELVLLTLLPYLGFSEAKRWADQVAAC